jgi:hypothetical protein
MSKQNKRKRLFTTDSVDDTMYMCADLHINKTFKNGLEFEFERQNGSITDFTLYREGVEKLNEFLTNWLKENE